MRAARWLLLASLLRVGPAARAEQVSGSAAVVARLAAPQATRPQTPADPPGWGDGKTTPGSEPADEPAKGPAYNYIQMGLGALICGLMALFVVWLVRRSTRTR